MSEANNLQNYNRAGAAEYEAVYAKPERQADLRILETWLAGKVRDQTILELACGTGYWTSVAARTAKLIHATDINREVIKVAQAKPELASVKFEIADIASLATSGKFDCVMAHFWWSHMQKSELADFARGLRRHLIPNGKFIAIDNRFVPGSSIPISRTDIHGNTYQQRKLSNGSEYEVLKNFPTTEELNAILSQYFQKVECETTEYYWTVVAETPLLS
jgi:ubiquinone/menaquinone biosynthesis C-methylase UbiE